MSDCSKFFGHGLRDQWSFAPDTLYLNHGAFGALPKAVAVAQDDWRSLAESQPTRFFAGILPGALADAIGELGSFLGAPPGSLAFVENATTGMNAVLRSFPWRRGDAIVLADRAYPAVRNLVQWLAERYGLEVRWARIPTQVPGPDTVADAYLAAAGENARMAVVDHVFSGSGLVAPVRDVAARLHARGVKILVDAAHSAGMLALDVAAIGADWVVGDLHKWMFAPRGCGFLYAPGDGVAGLQPAAISGLAGMAFPDAFAWTGTRDYSPFLAVPAALAFLQWLGPEAYRRRIRELAWDGACLMAERWGVDRPGPAGAFGAMVAVPLPAKVSATDEAARAWGDRLWERHRIAVPVACAEGRLWVRVSAQVYNELSDFSALADAVPSP